MAFDRYRNPRWGPRQHLCHEHLHPIVVWGFLDDVVQHAHKCRFVGVLDSRLRTVNPYRIQYGVIDALVTDITNATSCMPSAMKAKHSSRLPIARPAINGDSFSMVVMCPLLSALDSPLSGTTVERRRLSRASDVGTGACRPRAACSRRLGDDASSRRRRHAMPPMQPRCHSRGGHRSRKLLVCGDCSTATRTTECTPDPITETVFGFRSCVPWTNHSCSSPTRAIEATPA